MSDPLPTTPTLAITGSSGLIGTALTARLAADGFPIRRIVRRDPAPGDVVWHPAKGHLRPEDLAGVDVVINLAGAG